jgi:hypothetical protein
MLFGSIMAFPCYDNNEREHDGVYCPYHPEYRADNVIMHLQPGIWDQAPHNYAAGDRY